MNSCHFRGQRSFFHRSLLSCTAVPSYARLPLEEINQEIVIVIREIDKMMKAQPKVKVQL